MKQHPNHHESPHRTERDAAIKTVFAEWRKSPHARRVKHAANKADQAFSDFRAGTATLENWQNAQGRLRKEVKKESKANERKEIRRKMIHNCNNGLDPDMKKLRKYLGVNLSSNGFPIEPIEPTESLPQQTRRSPEPKAFNPLEVEVANFLRDIGQPKKGKMSESINKQSDQSQSMYR